jgi:ATP-dependent DNA helicase RecG
MLGIESVADLLSYYPRRYIDRTREGTIADTPLGENVLILGHVVSVSTKRLRNGRTIVEAIFRDETGSVGLTFFNQPWRERQLRTTDELAIFGKLEVFRRSLTMTNPTVDVLGDRSRRVVPVYSIGEKAGLSTSELARFVGEALDRAGEFVDPVPPEILRNLALIDRTTAYRLIHFPESMDDRFAARKRLAFDELFRLQTILVMRKLQYARDARGIAHDTSPYNVSTSTQVRRFLERMPFPLTKAQQRVIAEIASDMKSSIPMHRLLQGDVGSGKTLVALVSLLFGVQGGYQGALLAPTEVLAEQHYRSISSYLSEIDIRDDDDYSLFQGQERPISVSLLTGSLRASQRRTTVEAIQSGTADIVIGTHALFSQGVDFRNLGVIVVDEQHRFGVEQRSLLRERASEAGGRDPDVLVMTATPIPRTAAMTLYGDLDVSVIDELPPGRTPIETSWMRGEAEAEAAFAALRREVEDGRQAYVVCPLVEESDKLEASSARAEFERLADAELKGLQLGLLHGQLKAQEKDETMARFRQGEIDVLVATTVIEVGVDVPNATVMVIEDADRFGIAQLHQLRGRVGRGSHRSYCYLLSSSESVATERRLEAMVASTDGFYLAEIDLELRGEGTILGTRQQGRSDLRLASIRHDKDLVIAARGAAERIVSVDPTFAQHDALRREIETTIDPEEAAFLFRS